MIRYEFVDSSINEANIHPGSIYKKEQELAKKFVSSMSTNEAIDPCPISGLQERHEILFSKWGQQYALCPKTWSLSLASLPDENILRQYFYNSELAQFRASSEYQKTVATMRKSLWENQIEWIEGRVRRYLGMGQYTVIDWGSKVQAWNDALSNAEFISALYTEEPLPPLGENLPESEVDLVVLFDVIQRVPKPNQLFSKIYNRLKPGGIVVITCRSGSGFDILTLREHSESIFPLDHICLPSPKGMQRLIERSNLEILELTTPGLLDVQFVKNAGPHIPNDQYFARYLIEQCNDSVLERFQGILQHNNLSSHMRVVARKPEI